MPFLLSLGKTRRMMPCRGSAVLTCTSANSAECPCIISPSRVSNKTESGSPLAIISSRFSSRKRDASAISFALLSRFTPSSTAVSSVKKWIAHSEGFAKGELHLNEQASQILQGEKAVSILPIGIVNIKGEFEKDDIVRIVDATGRGIGVGKANCDSTEAREGMGQHGKRPVVHYDYLYIE